MSEEKVSACYRNLVGNYGIIDRKLTASRTSRVKLVKSSSTKSRMTPNSPTSPGGAHPVMSWLRYAFTSTLSEAYWSHTSALPSRPASSPAYQWNSIVFSFSPAAILGSDTTTRSASNRVTVPDPLSSIGRVSRSPPFFDLLLLRGCCS